MIRPNTGTALLIAAATLAAGAPAFARPEREAAEKSADARDKVICKRFVETGSLVKGRRVCQTKADWDRDRAEIRSFNNPGACGQIGQGADCR